MHFEYFVNILQIDWLIKCWFDQDLFVNNSIRNWPQTILVNFLFAQEIFSSEQVISQIRKFIWLLSKIHFGIVILKCQKSLVKQIHHEMQCLSDWTSYPTLQMHCTTKHRSFKYFTIGVFTNTQNWQCWHQRFSLVKTNTSSNKMLPQ